MRQSSLMTPGVKLTAGIHQKVGHQVTCMARMACMVHAPQLHDSRSQGLARKSCRAMQDTCSLSLVSASLLH